MKWLYKKCLELVFLLNWSQLELEYRFAKEASDESFEYVKNNMKDALIFSRRAQNPVLNYGLTQIKNSGLILEFGVFAGSSISIIAKKLPDKKIHGFDTFYGLPSDWSTTDAPKGTFSVKGKLPKVPRNVELHKGLFSKTLPDFVKNHNEKIALLHINSDLYSSAKTVLGNLSDKIQKGTIIVIGGYINHFNWKEHEYKAFQEFVKQNNITYKYLAVGGNAGSVCVEITDGEGT